MWYKTKSQQRRSRTDLYGGVSQHVAPRRRKTDTGGSVVAQILARERYMLLRTAHPPSTTLPATATATHPPHSPGLPEYTDLARDPGNVTVIGSHLWTLTRYSFNSIWPDSKIWFEDKFGFEYTNFSLLKLIFKNLFVYQTNLAWIRINNSYFRNN